MSPVALGGSEGRTLYRVETPERVFLLNLSANAALFSAGHRVDVVGREGGRVELPSGVNGECHRSGTVTVTRKEEVEEEEEEGWAAVSDCNGLVSNTCPICNSCHVLRSIIIRDLVTM